MKCDHCGLDFPMLVSTAISNICADCLNIAVGKFIESVKNIDFKPVTSDIIYEKYKMKQNNMETQITKTEVISTEKMIDITVTFDEISYRFRAVVVERSNKVYVRDISFRDKYEVALKNSLRKRMCKSIKEHFEKE
jgi:C-terminal processing protease CtpA/Prc